MGAQHLLAIVEQAGGEILVGSGNGSLVAAFRLKNGKTAYPFSLWPAGAVSLNLKWLKVHPGPFHASEDRQALVAKLRDRGVPWTSSNPDGFPSFVVSALEKSGVAEAVKIVLALIAGQT